MKNNIVKKRLSLFAAGISTLALVGAPVSVFATSNTDQTKVSTYSAYLNQLNNTGVSGKAHLNYQPGSGTDALMVNLSARGTTPNQTHAVHIHGLNHPEVASCPTTAVNTNGDRFISVIEGAATYGKIKLNLTTPQTPFGPGPSDALFTPFAGTPGANNAFPKANANGSIHLNQRYNFDGSAAARGALASLMPLENQHIVVHGGMAPASVDADAFAALGAPVTGPMNAVVYDALLPVACGKIVANGSNSATHTEKIKDNYKKSAQMKHNFHNKHQR